MATVHLVLTNREVFRFEGDFDGPGAVSHCREVLERGGTFVVDMPAMLANGPVLDLGRRVAAARKALGWSQAELAERLELSTSWISQVERGVRVVDRLSVIDLLARTLNIDFRAESSEPANPDEWIVIPAASVLLVRVSCEGQAGSPSG